MWVGRKIEIPQRKKFGNNFRLQNKSESTLILKMGSLFFVNIDNLLGALKFSAKAEQS